MFLAYVNLGEVEYVDYSNKERAKLIEPPNGKDSVRGHTNNSDIYIVYANKKAYPQFIITYLH
jgi:hypothetical protein